MGKFVEETPTIGLNVKLMQKGRVFIKAWDIGGQQQYRSEWGRYARGCHVIIFVVDTQNVADLATAKQELHRLLENPHVSKLPLLILANKIDLGPKLSEQELIRGLNLDYVTENPWLIIPISAKYGSNVDKALEFLIGQSKQ